MSDIDIFLNAPEGASAAELASYLEEACAGDLELRSRVDALFAEDQASECIVDRAPRFSNASDVESEGAVIGPYKLLQKIGEGGFGTVYMAEQLHPVKTPRRSQDYQARDGYAADRCALRG